jgi:hypothetical protein
MARMKAGVNRIVILALISEIGMGQVTTESYP